MFMSVFEAVVFCFDVREYEVDTVKGVTLCDRTGTVQHPLGIWWTLKIVGGKKYISMFKHFQNMDCFLVYDMTEAFPFGTWVSYKGKNTRTYPVNKTNNWHYNT